VALLVLIEWEECRQLDWERICGLMGRPLVIDSRNLLEPNTMGELGFEYNSFGRPMDNRAPALVRTLVH
jgi:UDPglucose 6-dehydrogenase